MDLTLDHLAPHTRLHNENRILTHRRKLERVARWLRCCAICHSMLPPIDVICANCSSELRRRIQRGWELQTPDYPFPVYALFTWRSEQDIWLRPLLYAFKGGYTPKALTWFVESLAFERERHFAGRVPCFVHPPASQDRFDHSWLLARLLAERFQGHVLVLEPASEALRGPQKSRSAVERREKRFTTPEVGLPPLCLRTPFIFIDDVLTTGSTAMAAYMALDEPEDFEVWTLAARPKLAGKSRF